MNSIERLIFVIVCFGAIAFFLKNASKLFALMCMGRWENRFDNLWSRFGGMLKYGFGQRRVISRKYGINHFFIFWGFLILVCVYFEFLINGIFPEFNLGFLGTIPYGILLFLADIMSFVVLIGVIIAIFRRTFFRPAHIAPSFDAYFILSLIGILMIAFFTTNAAEANLNNLRMISWMPISNRLSVLFASIAKNDVHIISRVFWWIHAILLLFFLNYLPYSKHLHILTALPNCFFRSPNLISTVPRLKFSKGEEFGVSKVFQYTWKDLLDFMACTECGRCQSVCPATITDKLLNPQQIIHKGKVNLFKNGVAIRAIRPADMLASAPANAKMVVPLINGGEESITKDEIWACTTCGACMQVCPVFIEHTPKIISMRQHLVMEKAEFPEELNSLFEATEQRFNPWGIAPADRTKWAIDLNIPVISEGEKVEYLFYVGCAGSFDSRARQISISLTRILNKAKVSYGILGNKEKCCGDPLRKLGNEYLFDKIVHDNIESFKKYGIKKIITACPHCFSTLKNDYKQYGADFEVIHHTQLISELITEGKIKPKSSNSSENKTVIHDSCYLGRYNQIYKEPRDIVKACSNGKSPVEMENHGNNSFCCGAGGGRMWMEELPGKRIYLERTHQALKTNASTIAVACPYCMTMFEDGLKDEGVSDKVCVKDIAEIVDEAIK